ncbi:MAG: Peptidase protein [Patescibacteria group bacterium]|nr:Peptidase protein [Patescibacteria group bacterium]
MKPSHVFKKQYFRQLSYFALIIILGAFFVHLSFAQTVSEIKDKINQKSEEIAKLEKEIKAYQSQLNSIALEKDSLKGAIAELDITRKKLNADISITQKKIDQTNYKIQVLSNDIGNKEDSISNSLDAIAIDIRRINELEITNIAETILSKDNFTTIWNDIDSMLVVREEIRERISELKLVKGELEDTRDVTIEAKNELTRLKSQLDDQKKIVDQNTKAKKTLLAQTQNSEANYQKLLADQVAKKAAFEKEIRDYESQLQFILDPSKLPSGGVLGWPLDNIYVTQFFGKTVAAKRLYASGSHSGVDFRAAVGTPVKSMANGIVKGAGDTDTTCVGASFGKWIFIEYENGLSSTYGHLSLIKVKSGQKVKRGEVVGYSGSTGRVTGPHLHVTVYAASAAKVQTLPSKSCPGKTLTQPIAAINAYLDPMFYLPPYSQ